MRQGGGDAGDGWSKEMERGDKEVNHDDPRVTPPAQWLMSDIVTT